MKLRTLAVMAISGMFAASFAYAAAPTMMTADDTSTMNAGTMSGSMSGSVGGMQNNDMSSQNGSQNIGGAPEQSNPSNNASGTDDMSADTATGDDDY